MNSLLLLIKTICQWHNLENLIFLATTKVVSEIKCKFTISQYNQCGNELIDVTNRKPVFGNWTQYPVEINKGNDYYLNLNDNQL